MPSLEPEGVINSLVMASAHACFLFQASTSPRAGPCLLPSHQHFLGTCVCQCWSHPGAMAGNATDKDLGLTELTLWLGENSVHPRQASSGGPGAMNTLTGPEGG